MVALGFMSFCYLMYSHREWLLTRRNVFFLVLIIYTTGCNDVFLSIYHVWLYSPHHLLLFPFPYYSSFSSSQLIPLLLWHLVSSFFLSLFFLLYFLSPPPLLCLVSLIRVALRSMGEELFTGGAWAFYQWLHYWKMSLFPQVPIN